MIIETLSIISSLISIWNFLTLFKTGTTQINEYNYYINCKFEITADKNLRIKKSPKQNNAIFSIKKMTIPNYYRE